MTTTPSTADLVATPPRTVTGARETAADTVPVLDVLADAHNLSRWAPGFADEVTHLAGERWAVRKGADHFEIRVVVQKGSGTVDYLREVTPDVWLGAFLRVTPRPGDGSVITMTLPIVPDADAITTAQVLDSELTTLTELVPDD
jgi:hypothetical protein